MTQMSKNGLSTKYSRTTARFPMPIFCLLMAMENI
jgi:hypothetical protein